MWSEQVTNSVGQQQLSKTNMECQEQLWSNDGSTEDEAMGSFFCCVSSARFKGKAWFGRVWPSSFVNGKAFLAISVSWCLNSAPTLKISFIEIFPWRFCDSLTHTRGVCLGWLVTRCIYPFSGIDLRSDIPSIANPQETYSIISFMQLSGKNPSGFSNQFKLR